MDHILRAITSELSWPEIIASLTGLISVYLLVKNNIWNWFWGIISVLLFGWVFYASKLYSNAGLQLLYFLPMQFYGWWIWAKCGPTHNDDLPITLLTPVATISWVILMAVSSLALGMYMSHYTDAALPYWDATVTCISIGAQYLQARKNYENWILWIVIDIISVFYLFPMQHLYVTTGLYVIFMILAVQGAVEWLGLMKQQEKYGH